jgi:hypothetical protein
MTIKDEPIEVAETNYVPPMTPVAPPLRRSARLQEQGDTNPLLIAQPSEVRMLRSYRGIPACYGTASAASVSQPINKLAKLSPNAHVQGSLATLPPLPPEHNKVKESYASVISRPIGQNITGNSDTVGLTSNTVSNMEQLKLRPARQELKTACKYCGVVATKRHEISHVRKWACSKCPGLKYSSTSMVSSHLNSHGHHMVAITVKPEPLQHGAPLLSAYTTCNSLKEICQPIQTIYQIVAFLMQNSVRIMSCHSMYSLNLY